MGLSGNIFLRAFAISCCYDICKS